MQCCAHRLRSVYLSPSDRWGQGWAQLSSLSRLFQNVCSEPRSVLLVTDFKLHDFQWSSDFKLHESHLGISLKTRALIQQVWRGEPIFRISNEASGDTNTTGPWTTSCIKGPRSRPSVCERRLRVGRGGCRLCFAARWGSPWSCPWLSSAPRGLGVSISDH